MFATNGIFENYLFFKDIIAKYKPGIMSIKPICKLYNGKYSKLLLTLKISLQILSSKFVYPCSWLQNKNWRNMTSDEYSSTKNLYEQSLKRNTFLKIWIRQKTKSLIRVFIHALRNCSVRVEMKLTCKNLLENSWRWSRKPKPNLGSKNFNFLII